MRHKLLTAYALLSIAHLLALAAGPHWLEWATKPLLMPVLAGWVLLAGGPRLIVGALALSALGDIALELPGGTGLFIAGMVCFAGAHACYVTYFVRSGALAGLRRRRWVVAGYAALWIGLVAVLWPHLGALQVPVALYSLLLIGTGITSAGYGRRTGLGGALFVCSDAILALGIAKLSQPWPAEIWIMSTYVLAQYLLASGASRARRRGRR